MNSETTHMLAKQQYFELRIALNKSNKVKDLTSELEFELRENDEEYFVIIKSTQAINGLRITTYLKQEYEWSAYPNEKYQEFNSYMFKKIFLLNPSVGPKIISDLTDWLYRLWVI